MQNNNTTCPKAPYPCPNMPPFFARIIRNMQTIILESSLNLNYPNQPSARDPTWGLTWDATAMYSSTYHRRFTHQFMHQKY